MLKKIFARGLLALTLAALANEAGAEVGELHRSTTTPTASLRNADGSSALAVTAWYPARPGSLEQPLMIGPPGQPLFATGAAAADASPAQGRFPVILLSHGFGGTARIMGWFGTALARAGYIVIAVDHPGSNGRAAITANGAAWWWERAEDLKSAWVAMQKDPVLAPHIDSRRLGVAGFSAGGFAALVAGGARVDVQHFVDFCRARPDDGVCAPQWEAPELTARDTGGLVEDLSKQGRLQSALGDHAIPGVRAVFVMAPALVQALAPDSLRRMKVPVSLLTGAADTVAPASTNADVAARSIPGAKEQHLDGVTHYDFLGSCLPAASKSVPQCAVASHQAIAHTAAVAEARRIFGAALSE